METSVIKRGWGNRTPLLCEEKGISNQGTFKIVTPIDRVSFHVIGNCHFPMGKQQYEKWAQRKDPNLEKGLKDKENQLEKQFEVYVSLLISI